MSNLRINAIALARRGMAVLPCQPRGKTPVTARGVLDASADVERVTAWWTREPTMNIAIATGAASGIWVLDIDGDEGEQSLRGLEAKHGELPRTVEAITGKGRHCYFRYGGRPIKNSVGQIATGIDVRADHGYVVAPPSLHPSGRPYAWSVDTANEFAEPPDWLLALIVGTKGSGKGKPLEHWHRVLTGAIHNGERNSTLTSLCGKLLHAGLKDVVLLHDVMVCINIARCSEPLSEAELDRILSSVLATHYRRNSQP